MENKPKTHELSPESKPEERLSRNDIVKGAEKMLKDDTITKKKK